MTLFDHIYYILVAFVVSIVFYHPFITKLDRVRYLVFCTSTFLFALFFNISSLEHDAIPRNSTAIDPYQFLTHPSLTYRPSDLGPLEKHAQGVLVSLNRGAFADICLLTLMTATAINLTGLLSRWTLPILFIRPQASALWSAVLRHIPSMLILTLIHSSHPIVSFSSPIVSALWLLSGNYFIRRWRIILTVTLVSALCGAFCVIATTHRGSSSMMQDWSMMDWCAWAGTVTLAICALDHWDAILNMYPHLVSRDVAMNSRIQSPAHLSYWIAMGNLVSQFPSETDLPSLPLQDLQSAIRLLGPASRSWKVMASLFPVSLRQELCLLYAFFRTADDLVDDAPTIEQRRSNLSLIRRFLKDVFHSPKKNQHQKKHSQAVAQDPSLRTDIDWDMYARELPSEDALAVFRSFSRLAPYLCPRAAFELTDAWEMDLRSKPMANQDNLLRYAELISGTFGELCTCLIMYKLGYGNWNGKDSAARNDQVLSRARATGQCLQLINIARDIIADSLDGRCYVPLQYMQSRQTFDILKNARNPTSVGERVLKSYALRILKLADRLTVQAQKGIDGLPSEVQDGVRAAFEIYFAISPALKQAPGYPIRVKVPKYQQYFIALGCIYGVHAVLKRTMAMIRRGVTSQARVPKLSATSRHLRL